MKVHKVDVIILGAGTAGLSAAEETLKHSNKLVIINAGPYGTTCALKGCMPAHSFLEAAYNHNHTLRSYENGLYDGALPKINSPKVFERVRELRERFLKSSMKDFKKKFEKYCIDGEAKFIDANTVEVNGECYVAEKGIIVATGSSPFVPVEMSVLGNKCITSTDFFELKELPEAVVIYGSNSMALEFAQGISRLGSTVALVIDNEKLCGMDDPVLLKAALKFLGKDIIVTYKDKVTFERDNNLCSMRSEDIIFEFDLAISLAHRIPNTKYIGLENIPNWETQKIFLAGDAGTGQHTHEATRQGKESAMRCFGIDPQKELPWWPYVHLSQTDPVLAICGESYEDAKRKEHAIVEVPMSDLGRAIIADSEDGFLRLYVNKEEGIIEGASMVMVNGHHVVQMIACLIQQKTPIRTAIELPFYHPTLEESVRLALQKL